MWDKYEAWLYQIMKIPKRRRRVLLGWEKERNVEELCKLINKQLEVYITRIYKENKIDEKYAIEDAKLIEQEHERISPEDLYAEYKRKGIQFVSQMDSEYPCSLHHIHDKPMAIYQIQGDNVQKNLLKEVPVVAIIGARECTEYGAYIAKELGKLCARYGIHVVSGLAYGIDSIAQRAARQGGATVTAVLGSGADVCYPAKNQDLYDDLAQHGRIISEYIPGTQPKPQFFPPRNRIISGLSDAVIVVEAKKKSGTLITVDMALEQGKDVYVVPGRLTDAMSYGCNRLISQGAEILYDMEATIEEIRSKKMIGKAQIRQKTDMDKNDIRSGQGDSYLNGTGPMDVVAGLYGANSLECLVFQKVSVNALNVDQILNAVMRERDVTYSQLVSILLMMEMDGVIYEEAGRYAASIFC